MIAMKHEKIAASKDHQSRWIAFSLKYQNHEVLKFPFYLSVVDIQLTSIHSSNDT